MLNLFFFLDMFYNLSQAFITDNNNIRNLSEKPNKCLVAIGLAVPSFYYGTLNNAQNQCGCLP